MAKEPAETPEKARTQQEQEATAVSSGGAATHHNWRNIRLITEREYKNRVTQRSFIITSIILIAVVAVAAFIPTILQYIDSRTHAQTSVVVVNNTGMIGGLDETALISTINTDLNGANSTSPAPYAISSQLQTAQDILQNQVENGKLDILLVLDRAANGDLRLTYYTHSNSANDSNLPKMQVLAQQLTFLDAAQRLGLTPSQTRTLLAQPSLTVVHTQQSQSTRPVNERVAGYVLAFAGCVLMYVAVAIYANSVAVGVAEEKSSRVMELLVNAATPFQLMIGKIVGIGAACLTQMACLVVVGIGTLLLQTPLQAALFGANGGGFIQYLTGISIPFYLLFLVYFLLVFFLYATAYAGLGASVKRQDEVQSATVVPGMLIFAGYAIVYLGVAFPDATWVKVLSYIPFFTPTLMLVRVALGTVAWWEVVLTIGLMMATIFAITLFSARLYRYGVMMYGQKPGLRQLAKMVRMK